MIRKVILLLVLLVMGLLGGLAFALQSPICWQKLIMAAANNRFPGVSLKSVVIKQVHLTHDGDLLLGHLNCKLRVNGATYFISTGIINVSDLWQIFKNKSNLPVVINHLTIVSDTVNISDLAINGQAQFKGFNFVHFNAELKIRAFEFEKYALNNLGAIIDLDMHQAKLGDFSADFYDGRINGLIHLDYQPQIGYSIVADVTNVEISKLADVVPSLSSLKGIVDGKLVLRGKNDQLIELNAHFNQPQGGEMKAELLTYLVQYIPQRQQIEDLIKRNVDIHLDRTDIKVASITDKKLATQIKLLSSKLGLDINLTIDVNIEDGFLSLLGNLKQLSK